MNELWLIAVCMGAYPHNEFMCAAEFEKARAAIVADI